MTVVDVLILLYCGVYVKATPEVPRRTGTVFCSPTPATAHISHSDEATTTTTEFSSAAFSTSSLGNPRFLRSPCLGTSEKFHNGSTGLSMELGGVSLSASEGLASLEGCCDGFDHSVPDSATFAKHCLNFEQADDCSTPKRSRKCVSVDDEPDPREQGAEIARNHDRQCDLPAKLLSLIHI